MKLKLRLNGKMLLFILGITLLVSTITLAFIAFKLKKMSAENAAKRLEAKSAQLAQEVRQELNKNYEVVATACSVLEGYESVAESGRRALYIHYLENLMQNNPRLVSAWACFEPNALDSLDEQYKGLAGNTGSGIFAPRFYNIEGAVVLDKTLEADTSANYTNYLIEQVKHSGVTFLAEPKYIQIPGQLDSIYQTQLVLPLFRKNEFVGAIGISMPLTFLQEAYANRHPFETGRFYVLSNQGQFIVHPDKLFLHQNFNFYASTLAEKFKVMDKINLGQVLSFIGEEPILEEKSLFHFNPIQIGDAQNSWSVCVSVPLIYLYERANRTFSFAVFLSIITLLLVTFLLLGISSSISKPLISTTNLLQHVAKGEIQQSEELKFYVQDEISDMVAAVNELTSGLNEAAVFARQIGDGNLNSNYKLLSEQDVLGNSLITMQKSLIKARELEEKKRLEDEKRNWVTHGLAKFGEIIRQYNEDMDKFTMNVLRHLIEYLDVAQGAIYISQQIENDTLESDVFELKAVMAYGKPVMINKQVERGKELVGRAIDENKMIVLDELPEHFVELSPGMQNKERPRNLVLAPIAIKDLSLGVFELLSYHKFEGHQLEFLEKLCENIASVISSVKTNIRTAKLLEQSQSQADELAQHEEEMRQNLEEMLATQEEASKREDNLKNYIKAIKSNVMIAELDMNGRVIDMSANLAAIYGSNIETMIGKFYDVLFAQDSDSQAEFSEFWEQMMANGKGRRLHKFSNRKKDIWIDESYQIIKRDRMAPIIQVVAYEKTREKELYAELKAAIENLKGNS